MAALKPGRYGVPPAVPVVKRPAGIVRVTGILNGVGRLGGAVFVVPAAELVMPEPMVIVPVYVPGVSAVGSISTVSVCGVLPVFGATNSHPELPALAAVARKSSEEAPSVLVIAI